MSATGILEARLEELTSEIGRLETDLTRQLEAQHGGLENAMAIATDEGRRVQYLESIAADVSSALNAAAARLQGDDEPRRKELQDTREAKAQAEKQVAALQEVVSVTERFEGFDAAVEENDLSGALAAAVQLDEAVSQLVAMVVPPMEKENAAPAVAVPGPPEKHSAVVRILKRLARRRRTQLESWLRRLLAEGVVITPGSIIVQSRVGGHALGDVFQAIFDLDVLEEVHIDLVRLIMAHILVPLLTQRGRQADAIATSHPTPASSVLRLHLDDPLPGAAPVQLPAALFAEPLAAALETTGLATDVALSRVLQVLVFVHEAVFGENLALSAAFGQTLLLGPEGAAASSPSHQHLLHSLCHLLTANLPEQPKGLPALAAPLTELTTSFDRQLFAMGFLPNEASALSALTAQLSLRHATFRRARILQAARTAFLGDYHNCLAAREAYDAAVLLNDADALDVALMRGDEDDAGEAEGDGEDLLSDLRAWASDLIGDAADPRPSEGLLLLPSCQVTTTAREAATLLHRSLQLATEATPAAATVLYHTARDLLDLFRALVPAQHGAAIREVPRLSALLFNDCGFLAHAALTVGFMYRGRLPEEIAAVACCVDLAQPLRQLADETLREAWVAQREQILSFLGPCGAGPPSSPPELSDAAIRRVLHHLHQLQAAWQSVLPEKVYARAVGGLADTVLARVTSGVFKVAAAHNLDPTAKVPLPPQLLHTLGANFQDLRGGVEGLFPPGAEALAKSQAWGRFLAVKSVLGASLAEIADQLGVGLYRELSAAELGALVEAIFQNDASRATILAAVHQ